MVLQPLLSCEGLLEPCQLLHFLHIFLVLSKSFFDNLNLSQDLCLQSFKVMSRIPEVTTCPMFTDFENLVLYG